jgi:hypothetical protein
LQGQATYTCSNGDKLEYGYLAGKKQGPITRFYKNGDVETAQFVGDDINLNNNNNNNNMRGKGTYKFANGNQEEYEWVRGQKQGKATMVFVNGDKEEYK